MFIEVFGEDHGCGQLHYVRADRITGIGFFRFNEDPTVTFVRHGGAEGRGTIQFQDALGLVHADARTVDLWHPEACCCVDVPLSSIREVRRHSWTSDVEVRWQDSDGRIIVSRASRYIGRVLSAMSICDEGETERPTWTEAELNCDA